MDQKIAEMLVGKAIEIVHEESVFDTAKLRYVRDQNFHEEVLVYKAEELYFGYSTFGSDESGSLNYNAVKKWRELKGGQWKK